MNRSYQVNGLNQYTSAGAASFTHDANGNLTSDGSVTFIYDVENRLVQAMGAKQATLTYDPMGRLWQVDGTAAGGTITRFLYDGDALVAEYDVPGNLTDRYVHGVGADVPTQWYEGSAVNSSTRRHLFANWQGSIALISDASGNTVNINAYDAYGIANETNIGRFQYTGQIAIPELGLYHYKARVYSPTLGRFLQTDPIGYEDQVNLYAYVGNDPVNLVDPTGEEIVYLGERANDLESMVDEYRQACDECAQAVEALEKSDNKHIVADASVITDDKGNRNLKRSGGGVSVAFPRSKENDDARTNGAGTGTLVVVDLSSPATHDGVEYSQVSRLGHELQHSLEADSGTLPRNQIARENSAIDAANRYRSAVGEQLRPRMTARRGW